MTYKFKYKRKSLFSIEKTIEAVGHRYLPEQNKMVVFKQDGSLEEIVEWNKCSVSLGTDWVAATKKSMEQEAGTAIPLNIKG